ncbi:hypothetical protein K5D56_25445 [Pseudomonas cichorii]|nr:hypothetical protein [Pseudomonas cichorii]MBX8557004.1 hypothetical protein [Pseudomonas cichorii]MBX8592721.1 hypothetical protein [Pseudomonas cichorii]
MNISHCNLSFEILREAYVATLKDCHGKALQISGNALTLEGDNLYSMSSLEWDKHECCWVGEDSPEVTVSAVNTPVLIDIDPDAKRHITMLTYTSAMSAYRALLEANPGKALRLNKVKNGDAAALIDSELYCLQVGQDDIADGSNLGDLMLEAWGEGGWHGQVHETQDAIDNPVFVDIRNQVFVMNQHGHYFQINAAEVIISNNRFQGCTFFDNEEKLLQAVCDEMCVDLDEVEGSIFLITKKSNKTVLLDDRGLFSEIDEPVEKFVSTFVV